MNYLQLCQRLRSEAGVSGSGPSGVTGQTGFHLKLVEWVASAYQDIQNQHDNWLFLQEDFSFSTTIGTRAYTPLDAGISDLERWKRNEYGDMRCYSSVGVQDEQSLDYIPWENYKPIYLFGTNRTASGRPTYFSVKPNKTLDLHHVPDQIYTINGEYFQTPDIMSGNLDEPVFPSNFHMIIVWRALMMYGAYDAADEKYVQGKNEYRKLLKKIEADQLPEYSFGAPLA